MHQCLLLSTVFLVFVFLDEPIVVDTAETKDDDPNVKAENAFSEVIQNITRVNNVLQDLIKNYERLQKIYHSQESIEQHDYDDEGSSKYGNVKRSKDISTSAKSKDFPATIIPYSEGESEDSPEKTSEKEKSYERQVPTSESLKKDNSIDKAKKKRKKVNPTKVKDAKPEASIVTSDEITHQELAKEQKKPTEAKEVDEHKEIEIPKKIVERSRQNLEQKYILEHGSEEKANVNASELKSESPTKIGKFTENKRNAEGKGNAADSENEVQYEQRKHVYDNEKFVPKLKSRYVLKPVSSSTQKKGNNSHRSPESSHGNTNKKARKKTKKKDSPKKRTQKEGNPQDRSPSDELKNKKPEKGSSEDEKSIKKEQFKTSILRKAYGDACLKVVVKKCYKACKSTLKRACREYKCRSNFQLQFKEHSKTGCIREFWQPQAGKSTAVVSFEPDATFLKTVDKPKVKARDTDKNIDGFLDLTRNGYLAAACLPKARRTAAAPGGSDQPLNILRDRFERECQKVSCDKCSKACAYAVEKTCSTHNCVPEKLKALKKICSKECKASYRDKPKKNKNRSSGSSGSASGSSASTGSGSDSESGDSSSELSKSKEDKQTTKRETTTTAPGNTTLKKHPVLPMSKLTVDNIQDDTRLRVRVDTKS